MKLRKTEIQLLAEDVRNNIDQTLEITKFSITAACVLLGFGLSDFKEKEYFAALICLLPIPILITAVEMLFNRRLNIMRKATFLRNYGSEEYVWETFLRELRVIKNENNGPKKGRDKGFTRMLLGMLTATAALSVLASIIPWWWTYMILNDGQTTQSHLSEPTALVVGAIIIGAALFTLIYFVIRWVQVGSVMMGGDVEDATAEAWKKVEQRLDED